MNKNLLLILTCWLISFGTTAQNFSGSGIILNAVVIDNHNPLPTDARERLLSKLAQIVSENGVGSQGLNPRFVLAVKAHSVSKDIIPGPPQMMAMNIAFVFYIGDALTDQIFSTLTVEQKGIGTNENKAFLSAIQKIGTKNKDFTELVENGKSKIYTYYTQNCDNIISAASSLVELQKYDEAIYNLMQIPEAVSQCATKVLPLIQRWQQYKIDFDSKQLFNKAVTIWAANPTRSGADEVSFILGKISPMYTGFSEVRGFVAQIGNKIESIEKKEWDFKLMEFDSNTKLEQQRIEAAKATAIEYHRSRPQVIMYNRVYLW